MKYLYIVFLFLLFIHCESSKFDYPDGIEKPDILIESKGCANIFVYQFIDNRKAVSVMINGEKLGLSQQRRDFNLSDVNPNLLVNMEIAGTSSDSVYFNYCSDIAHINQGKTKKYVASSGILSLSVSEDNPIKDPEWTSRYKATVRVTDLHLVNLANPEDEITIPEIVFWDVQVGWMPG